MIIVAATDVATILEVELLATGQNLNCVDELHKFM